MPQRSSNVFSPFLMCHISSRDSVHTCCHIEFNLARYRAKRLHEKLKLKGQRLKHFYDCAFYLQNRTTIISALVKFGKGVFRRENSRSKFNYSHAYVSTFLKEKAGTTRSWKHNLKRMELNWALCGYATALPFLPELTRCLLKKGGDLHSVTRRQLKI